MASEELPLYTELELLAPDAVWGERIPPQPEPGWRQPGPGWRPPGPSWRQPAIVLWLERALDARPPVPITRATSHVMRTVAFEPDVALDRLTRQLPVREPYLRFEAPFDPAEDGAFATKGKLTVPWSWPTIPVSVSVAPRARGRTGIDLHIRRATRLRYPRRYFDVAHTALDGLLQTAGLAAR